MYMHHEISLSHLMGGSIALRNSAELGEKEQVPDVRAANESNRLKMRVKSLSKRK